MQIEAIYKKKEQKTREKGDLHLASAKEFAKALALRAGSLSSKSSSKNAKSKSEKRAVTFDQTSSLAM